MDAVTITCNYAVLRGEDVYPKGYKRTMQTLKPSTSNRISG